MKIATLIKRDLRLVLLRGPEGMTAAAFFVVVACLFPFAFGAEDKLLRLAAPGIIWVAALLSSLLSLEGVYHRDHEDGTMDLLLMSSMSTFDLAVSKIVAHWVLSGLPLLVSAFVVAHMLLLPSSILPVLLLSLLIGTLYMSMLGGMGAFLTMGARRPALLMALIVFPLYVPMLILGVSGIEAALAGMASKPYVLLQTALVVATLPISLLASSFCLQMNLRSS